MSLLENLINAVEASHVYAPAQAGAVDQLDTFETRSGFRLPPDLRAFYLRIHRADVAGRYNFLPVELFQRTGSALGGEEWADSEPPSWYAFCDVRDGDFVGIELEPHEAGRHRILDCDHDDASSRRVIATSFTEFLERALSDDGHRYYLDRDSVASVEVPYRPPVEWLKRQYKRWSEDPEVGRESVSLTGVADFAFPSACTVADTTLKQSNGCRTHSTTSRAVQLTP